MSQQRRTKNQIELLIKFNLVKIFFRNSSVCTKLIDTEFDVIIVEIGSDDVSVGEEGSQMPGHPARPTGEIEDRSGNVPQIAGERGDDDAQRVSSHREIMNEFP